jgi:2-polyprenyl-3-methyl-5-hydroxy-6-metoxy-1,4-benzoquinol methylase
VIESKREMRSGTTDLQERNRSWWTKETMSYDWNDRVRHERFSRAWFDEIDGRFAHAARLFATDTTPFDRIIPFEQLRGKRVLEIGCGMGFHSELLHRAGAVLSSIDLSPTSIEATRRRFELKGLSADIRSADAEALPFESGMFDFIWSWGVIHHSARTAKIVREASRVLKPEGECRVMVYNREGVIVPIVYLRDHIGKLNFLHQRFDQTLLNAADGFHARFYTADQLADLFRAFYENVSVQVYGQDADVLPVPRPIRNLLLPFVPKEWMKRRQAKSGAFLFVIASHPS